jgi:monooxygenase
MNDYRDTLLSVEHVDVIVVGAGLSGIGAACHLNASWTLKCDLTAGYVCRLLNHMDQHGYAVCTPRLNDSEIEEEPVIDFNLGYVLRALHTLPRQGSKKPWRLHQNYVKDLSMMRYGHLEDGTMEFRPARAG